MGKSRAEIQKAYRQRLKERLGEEYNRKERERMRKSYIPVNKLSDRKRKIRNENNKIRNQLSRQRKRDEVQRLNFSSGTDSTSGYYSNNIEELSPNQSSTSTSERMVVKLPAVARTNKRKRLRALANANKTIKQLKDEQQKLRRKLANKKKQLERLYKKVNQRRLNNEQISTPKRKTENELKKMQLTPKTRTTMKRKLLFVNALLGEIETSKSQSSTKKRGVLHRVISGRVIKKYRCISALNRDTGLSRRALSRTTTKDMQHIKETRQCIASKVEESVIAFMCREDNSRTQPGKADVKKTSDGVKRQTLVLTDYLKNLYEKYVAEYPEVKLSFSTFCRLRPKHILLARFISRNACQCIHHQNMAFKVQAMRNCGVKISDNPENILAHEHNLEELFKCIPQETVKYRLWKRVELENKQKKMKVIEREVSRDDFIKVMTEETKSFSGHVHRLRCQFQQLKKNKETLKEHEMIIQMDFAENFACRSLDEIQTAYWNQSSVTLHPLVVYFQSDGKLQHKSFVLVSDEMSHSASTVATFIDAAIPELKKIDPQLQKLHYWTDSPSSQYRNRYVFNLLANHMGLYGCKAQWNYFEAGHGKSACDGLGGTTKRLADEAVRQGNATIQDAQEFYQWGQKSNMKEVKFIFVEKEKCKQKMEEFSKLKIKPVKNTMKLHAIAVSGSVFKTKETSCYCKECQRDHFCSSWTDEQSTQPELREQQNVNMGEIGTEMNDINETNDTNETQIIHKANSTNETQGTDETTDEIHSTDETNNTDVLANLIVGEFIAAKYDSDWYIGEVVAVDKSDGDCNVNFMERAKNLFKWPKSRDELWIKGEDVICKVREPVQTGKSGRMFKITSDDLQKIEAMYRQ